MLVFLYLLIVSSEAIVNPQGPTVIGDFTNCVTEVIDFNFNEPGLIIFANTLNVSSSVARIRAKLLERIHSASVFLVEVKTPRKGTALCGLEDTDNIITHKDPFEQILAGDYFIIVVDTYNDFMHVAGRVVRSRTWNPEAKFIVLFFHYAKTDESNKKYVEYMLSCMFRQNVVKIVVIVPQANNLRNAIAYGWRPFDPPKYCGYFNETATNRLRVENMCEQGTMKYLNHVFDDKIPNKMQGCVLEILTIQRQPFVSEDLNEPNIERLFINQLADIYGFKTEYKSAGSVRGEQNDEFGNWNGALKLLANKQGHLLLGGIFPDPDVHEDFDCSITYLPDSYTWVVPRALQSPKYEALFIIFQGTVWYCVMAIFFLCVVSWKVLGLLNNETIYHKAFGHCFLNTWISHVGFCAYARPVKGSLRVFYVFFNLYCILFLTGYQTKLIDVLKNPTFEKQIHTIEELVASGLKFGGFEELHSLFLNSSDPFDSMLGDKWSDVINITEALIDVSVHRNFSVLCSRLELSHVSAVVPQLSDSSGDYKYFLFPENTFTVSVEMVSLKGFPFMRGFSYLLKIFKQLGVNAGVLQSFHHSNMRKKAKLLRELSSGLEENPLTLQHLQGGFLALALGYLSGSLALFFEIISNSKYVREKLSKFRAKLFTNRKVQ